MSKVKKPRGKYKQYAWNSSVSVPRSTICGNKKQIASPYIQRHEYVQSSCNNITACDSPINVSTNDVPTRIDDTTVSDAMFNDLLGENRSPVFSDDEINSFNKYRNESGNDDDVCLFNELGAALNNLNNILPSDLSAAYLAAFFNGSTSQNSLSDYLTLSNITSIIKIPTTFNGLTNLLIGNKINLGYEQKVGFV